MNPIKAQLAALSKQPPSEPDLEIGLPKLRQLITVNEAAAYLGCKNDHIYRLIDEGELTGENHALSATSKNRYLRIHRESLTDFRKRRRLDP
jgi:excisionase family DNA binding protein